MFVRTITVRSLTRYGDGSFTCRAPLPAAVRAMITHLRTTFHLLRHGGWYGCYLLYPSFLLQLMTVIPCSYMMSLDGLVTGGGALCHYNGDATIFVVDLLVWLLSYPLLPSAFLRTYHSSPAPEYWLLLLPFCLLIALLLVVLYNTPHIYRCTTRSFPCSCAFTGYTTLLRALTTAPGAVLYAPCAHRACILRLSPAVPAYYRFTTARLFLRRTHHAPHLLPRAGLITVRVEVTCWCYTHFPRTCHPCGGTLMEDRTLTWWRWSFTSPMGVRYRCHIW